MTRRSAVWRLTLSTALAVGFSTRSAAQETAPNLTIADSELSGVTYCMQAHLVNQYSRLREPALPEPEAVLGMTRARLRDAVQEYEAKKKSLPSCLRSALDDYLEGLRSGGNKLIVSWSPAITGQEWTDPLAGDPFPQGAALSDEAMILVGSPEGGGVPRDKGNKIGATTVLHELIHAASLFHSRECFKPETLQSEERLRRGAQLIFNGDTCFQGAPVAAVPPRQTQAVVEIPTDPPQVACNESWTDDAVIRVFPGAYRSRDLLQKCAATYADICECTDRCPLPDASQGEACTPKAPPPHEPPPDQPDDNVSRASLNVMDAAFVAGERGLAIALGQEAVGVLSRGLAAHLGTTLTRTAVTYSFLDKLPAAAADGPVVAAIASGGLIGLAQSQQFGANLESYVRSGATVVVYAQQHGSDFSILPTPDSRPIRGWGWHEDNSCYTNGAYIDTFHPILASQSSSLVTSNIDGYFDSIPDNAIVLLRRVKNGLPAMFMYPYGAGWVIVSSSYDDWGGFNQTGPGARAIIRDAIAWAKKPADLPINAPGSTGRSGSR